jgi:tetratricopeptide (TPR) repeat protein
VGAHGASDEAAETGDQDNRTVRHDTGFSHTPVVRLPARITMTEREALSVLRTADAVRAARAAAALWEMWHRSGRPELDTLLREGIETMERQDLAEAERIFGRLIDVAPEFAEGWNKRATVRYLAKNYAGSIADCRETVTRNPNHFGALSGQALCHLALEQYADAAALCRQALVVHPHLDGARANLRAALHELVKWN